VRGRAHSVNRDNSLQNSGTICGANWFNGRIQIQVTGGCPGKDRIYNGHLGNMSDPEPGASRESASRPRMQFLMTHRLQMIKAVLGS
jgi:hypothetical protein